MALLLLLLPVLAGCGTSRESAVQFAQSRGWHGEVLAAGMFDLQAFLSGRFQAGHPLVIYIEGDGMAWRSRYQLNSDPTPWGKPPGLQLALADGRPNVVYLGRPCQYVTDGHRRNCQPAYWDTASYSPEVIDGYGQAIDGLKRRAGADRVIVVGYSGGAAVAALVAAARGDCAGLVTVAGVLDHRAWTQGGGVEGLIYSLNPADKADALVKVPQLHFAGGRDSQVPIAQARSFANRFPAGRRPKIRVVEDNGHECCWADQWPVLATSPVPMPGEP